MLQFTTKGCRSHYLQRCLFGEDRQFARISPWKSYSILLGRAGVFTLKKTTSLSNIPYNTWQWGCPCLLAYNPPPQEPELFANILLRSGEVEVIFPPWHQPGALVTLPGSRYSSALPKLDIALPELHSPVAVNPQVQVGQAGGQKDCVLRAILRSQGNLLHGLCMQGWRGKASACVSLQESKCLQMGQLVGIREKKESPII